MDAARTAYFLSEINRAVMPSTGCTEPVAIALNTATARKHARGEIREIALTMDAFLYKNAMCVGIPGCDERGVPLCAALGATGGDADAGLLVLSGVTADAVAWAKRLCEHQVSISTREDVPGMYIETVLTTDEDCVRVLTLEHHTNIVRIDHAPFETFICPECAREDDPIREMTLTEAIEFASEVELSDIEFLQSGIEMNLRVAQAGYAFGLGKSLRTLMQQGVIGPSPVSQAELLCASASYARMSGVRLPVMTATGSGNQGITLLLTIEGVAQQIYAPYERKVRAAALASLVNIYVKSFIGTLSAMCACGVSSGLGASVGVVYLLGGDEACMLGAIKNILGSISGMICDGAKEGCANKVELSAGLAVRAAYLAMSGMSIVERDGILGADLHTLFANLGQLVREGMCQTNKAIVSIMQGKSPCPEARAAH